MSAKTCTIEYLWDGTKCLPSERVSLTLTLDQQRQQLVINIDAPFHNDPPPLHNDPSSESPLSFWKLWEYEVVEVFLVGEDGQYLEAEFSPHGHHLLLWLSGPREIVRKHLPVDFRVTHLQNHWKGQAYIDIDLIPHPIHRCNFFAIHGIGEKRRYLCHTPLNTPQPDFHQPHRFPLFQELS